MKKPVWIVVGASMSNNKFWAVAGPVIEIVGLALAGLGVRGRSS
jgi:hypothetical protein